MDPFAYGLILLEKIIPYSNDRFLLGEPSVIVNVLVKPKECRFHRLHHVYSLLVKGTVYKLL